MLIIDALNTQDTFTETEKRIANYILAHITEIPHIYIEDLARSAYTSHSAVIRLCKKIGYSGFRDFKLAIAEAVHSQQHTFGSVNANFPFNAQDSPMEIAKKMADLTINTINRTHAQLDNALLSRAADILSNAERIFLFSIGDSQVRGRSFQNKLIKIDKLVIIADEYRDAAWNAVRLTEKDCALFISYAGRNAQYQNILQFFKEEKIPTILLTGNNKSELVKLAQLPIVTIQEEYDFAKIATFSSQVSFEYILDTLYSILYAKEYDKNLIGLKRKQEILEKGILKEE
ncbi:MurR/RpiR family transcriptional regulator [uncultured Enterococcus sp.]|uniref:MurR/RpiR family transcriptional regulator n=1 Tax=uncultured Enterococcus sp. TaxID=167972 RepID=UPI002AA62DE0|nr:MurR/RpiR family transcriptional regulator [uncultured Enterococcus sp.]